MLRLDNAEELILEAARNILCNARPDANDPDADPGTDDFYADEASAARQWATVYGCSTANRRGLRRRHTNFIRLGQTRLAVRVSSDCRTQVQF